MTGMGMGMSKGEMLREGALEICLDGSESLVIFEIFFFFFFFFVFCFLFYCEKQES